MQDEVLNEIAAIAEHFMRLITPKLSTPDQALAMVSLSAATIGALAGAYGLDAAAQEDLQMRIRAVRLQMVAKRDHAVH